MPKRTYAEIHLGRIEKNYRTYKSLLSHDFRIIAVVKANAYGHGDIAVAKRLAALGVCHFAVATLEEGVRLSKSGVSGNILVLGYTPPECAEDIYNYGLTQTLIDEAYARMLASATDKKLKVQYAIDTGMRRIGLNGNSPAACERAIRRASEIFELNGIFTHLSAADGVGELCKTASRLQIDRFAAVANRVADMKLPFVHCLNTAGGMRFGDLPDVIGKFVRLGISLYGLSPSSNIILPGKIEPALSWYTTVASVRAVKKGESVGYGFGHVAKKDGIIATLTVGYADGYSRNASRGRAYVLINGKRAPVVGNVCMDQTMVDISGHANVCAGDVAVLIGESGNERITADDLGRMLGTIGYEVVCAISDRVDRIYTE